MSLEAGGSAKPILSGPFPEYDARISPNGQWLAYVSEEAGRPVVSVRAMPGPPRRLVVSSDDGRQPVWRRDGQELLYVDLDGRFRGRPMLRQRIGELTLGVANALNVPLIGSGTGARSTTCRQTGSTCTSSTGRQRRGRATPVS